MATYEKAEKSVTNLVKTVIGEHHPHLLEHKVTIEILMAHGKRNEENEILNEALKDRGHPVPCKVKINNLENRVNGSADARIVLDADHWETLGDKGKIGLLDHALSHLEMIQNVDGDQKFDDINRPKMRKRCGDWMIVGFYGVAKRHQRNSPEVDQFITIQKCEQMEFALALEAA